MEEVEAVKACQNKAQKASCLKNIFRKELESECQLDSRQRLNEKFISFLSTAYWKEYLVINPENHIEVNIFMRDEKLTYEYWTNTAKIDSFAKIYILNVGVPDMMGNYDPRNFRDDGLLMQYFRANIKEYIDFRQEESKNNLIRLQRLIEVKINFGFDHEQISDTMTDLIRFESKIPTMSSITLDDMIDIIRVSST